jgi:hypothetical protein
MPVSVSYPGVYIREVPSGAYRVKQRLSSVTC